MKRFFVILAAVVFVAGIFGCSSTPTKEELQKADKEYSSGVDNFKMMRYSHATKDFENAVDLNPQLDVAYNDLGCTYFKLAKRAKTPRDNYKKALESFQKAAEINPKDPDYLKNIGIAYEYLKEDGKAVEYYEKYLIYRPADKEVKEWIDGLKKSKSKK